MRCLLARDGLVILITCLLACDFDALHAQEPPAEDSVQVYTLEPITVTGRHDDLTGVASSASLSDVQYFYTSRLAGEPLAGVEDVHFHPAEPRQLRMSLEWGL